MSETTVRCQCGTENELCYEADGPEVVEVWLLNDDNGLECEGCKADIPADDVYLAATEAHAEALDEYDPTDGDAWSGGFARNH